MQKANFYFDGHNFYNGLVDSGYQHYYWLDIVAFSEKVLGTLDGDHELIRAYYFSAPPNFHKAKKGRQKRFFDANENNNQFKLKLGYHRDRSKNCNNCGQKIPMSEEKQTDVNIALYMLGKAVKKECNLSILVSGDTDMIPVIEAIKDVDPNHQIMAFFPPARKTNQMINYLDGWRDLSDTAYDSIFFDSLLPEKIALSNGNSIEIPEKWRGHKKNAGIDEATLAVS